MSNARKDGEPAFPNRGTIAPCPGMTLRDWFAGQALAGMIACDSGSWAQLATRAYQSADAMLAAREAGQ